MPVRFVGIDLAWGLSGRTGVCAARDGMVIDSGLLRTDDEILEWLKPHVQGPCLIAVDAPLIVRNQTGRRPCERVISRCFGRYQAGAHSSNLGIASFRNGVRAERLANALRFSVDPNFQPQTDIQRIIEVYPHPAMIALFGLNTIIRYKAKPGRTLEARSAALLSLITRLELLRSADPPFDPTGSPRWAALRAAVRTPSSGAHLGGIEDELDAYMCTYIAQYFWTHGEGRCRVVGNLQEGYIVTPTTEEIARCIAGQD